MYTNGRLHMENVYKDLRAGFSDVHLFVNLIIHLYSRFFPLSHHVLWFYIWNWIYTRSQESSSILKCHLMRLENTILQHILSVSPCQQLLCWNLPRNAEFLHMTRMAWWLTSFSYGFRSVDLELHEPCYLVLLLRYFETLICWIFVPPMALLCSLLHVPSTWNKVFSLFLLIYIMCCRNVVFLAVR